jgi:hypothetical protein
MKHISHKALILISILLLGVLAIITVGRSFILDSIRNRLETQLHKLRDAGYIVEYDSITIDWKRNTVEVFRLSVKNDIDSAICQKTDFIKARYIRAEGFHVLPLILKNHLSFGSIVLDSPHVVINERFLRPDSIKRKRKEFTIMVDNLKLPYLNFEVYDTRTCKIGSKYNAHAAVEDFKLAFYEDRPVFIDVTSLSADSIHIEIPEHFYTLTVKEISLKPSMGIFDLDTLRIFPHFDKVAFGRQRGFEVDRFEGLIPYINLYGLQIAREDSLTISAEKLTTQLFLKVFRDKRLPFRRKFKPLPMQALNQLPVGVNIGSVILNKSYVEYEEFPDGADSAGSVYFNNLFATIKKVNNTNRKDKGQTEMIAKADFMGEGVVKVHASFPWDTRKTQKISGTMAGLHMKKLNRMIEPAIQVSAESGYLNYVSFNFDCSNTHSKGEMEINYNNLKLITYKNEERIEKIFKRKRKKNDEGEDDEKVRKAAFKTFIVNTFIIRKNMDKEVPEEKRTGQINFERDQSKSVFNFWWKSLLSGVKAAYNLEKIQDSKITKLLRKKDKGEP